MLRPRSDSSLPSSSTAPPGTVEAREGLLQRPPSISIEHPDTSQPTGESALDHAGPRYLHQDYSQAEHHLQHHAGDHDHHHQSHDRGHAAGEPPSSPTSVARRLYYAAAAARARSSGAGARLRTILLVNLASVVEKADEQLLPAVYLFVGMSLNATPSQLGVLTLARALTQALSSPLSGVLGDKMDRTKVISWGCFLWAVMTAAIGCSTSLSQATVFCALNGLGLALVIPCCQSLLADYFPMHRRGEAFGWMATTANVGGMLGGLFATNLGHYSPMGVPGWRWAFFIVALISALTALGVHACARDPTARGKRQAAARHASHGAAAAAYMRSLAADLGTVVRIPTFVIIISQGIVGSFPWVAMVFLTLWMQLLGFSDWAASILMATFTIGCAVGSILGGLLGDMASRRSPSHGRAFVAQASVGFGLPLTWVLLKGLPSLPGGPPKYFGCFGALLLMMGALISWCFAGCNSPMFAEIVPASKRSTIYAFDRSFEGAIAACAAPIVGMLAERRFGFRGSIGAVGGDGSSAEERAHNAAALANSLMWCLVVPWTLCLLLYSGLHWTYPRDRLKIKHGEEPPSQC